MLINHDTFHNHSSSSSFLPQNRYQKYIGRFKVDDVTQDKREDCYLATLHINQADIQDARPYYLVVENERGIDRHSINLKVEGLFPGMTFSSLKIVHTYTHMKYTLGNLIH